MKLSQRNKNKSQENSKSKHFKRKKRRSKIERRALQKSMPSEKAL